MDFSNKEAAMFAKAGGVAGWVKVRLTGLAGFAKPACSGIEIESLLQN